MGGGLSWGGVNEELAKLRTGVGSAEMSHLKHCSLKIYLKRALGGDRGGQGGCDGRIEVFGKIHKKSFFFFFFLGGGSGGGGGGSGWVGG